MKQSSSLDWISQRAGAQAGRNRDFRCCEGFRMPAPDDGATDSGGRRPQTSKGGNRGTSGTAERQTLWRFRRWRFVAEVR